MEIIRWSADEQDGLIDVPRGWAVAVAADSELDHFAVAGYGELVPGAPLLLGGTAVRAKVTLAEPSPYPGVQTMPAYLASLVIATCPEELAALPGKRAPRWYRQSFAGAASGATMYVPFYGRRHAVIYYDIGEAGSVAVVGLKGALDNDNTAYDATLATIAQTTGAGGTYHVGGSGDEEESFDQLKLTISTTDVSVWTGEITVKVFGELGD